MSNGVEIQAYTADTITLYLSNGTNANATVSDVVAANATTTIGDISAALTNPTAGQWGAALYNSTGSKIESLNAVTTDALSVANVEIFVTGVAAGGYLVIYRTRRVVDPTKFISTYVDGIVSAN
jgi:hypothetical protein